MKSLDLQRTSDASKFYQIINSLLKYKVRGKIVKGIKEGEEILLRRDKRNKRKQYFNEIYRTEIDNTKYQIP